MLKAPALKLDLKSSSVPNRAGESVKKTANELKEPKLSNRDFLVSEVMGKNARAFLFLPFLYFEGFSKSFDRSQLSN